MDREASASEPDPRRPAPGPKSQTSRPLDVLDHPGAIVRRLESTVGRLPVDARPLDRAPRILDQGQTWPSIEKSRAIRLLGKPPLNLTAEEWENHANAGSNPHPEIDGYLARKLDRQLVEGLAQDQAATIEELRSVAEQAIARLEPLAADIASAPRPMRPAGGPPVVRHQQRGRAAAPVPLLVQPSAIPEPRHPTQSRRSARERAAEYEPSRARKLRLFRRAESLRRPDRDGTPPCPSDDLASCLCEIPADTQAVGGFTADTAEDGIRGGEFDPAVTGGLPTPRSKSIRRPDDDRSRDLQYEPTTPSADHATRQDEPTSPQVANRAFHATLSPWRRVCDGFSHSLR